MKNKKTKTNKTTLTLMCGLPRCGKSTWIRKNKKDEVIVSPDEIRKEIFGHQFHLNAEGFIWSLAESMTILLLKQKKNVIIDATNINFVSRGKWIKLAKLQNSDVKIVFLRTDLDKCISRNKKSLKGESVPEDVILNMALFFEDPVYDSSEGVEVVIVGGKNNKNKGDFQINYYEDICRKNLFKEKSDI